MKSYNWKNIELPHGTGLTAKYKKKYYYAIIKDGKIFAEKSNVQFTTPSQWLTTVCGNKNRNAWREILILRPGDKQPQPAFCLRQYYRIPPELI